MVSYSRIETLVRLILCDSAKFDHYYEALRAQPAELVSAYVEQIKQEIDSHYGKDPRVSLELANRIIGIGWIRQDTGIIALGVMARGDSIRFLGGLQEAWETLRLAGKLFLSAGNQVGWARTRIGRVPLGAQLNQLDQVVRESQIARSIFLRAGETERVLGLNLNLAVAFLHVGAYQQALQMHLSAANVAESLDQRRDYYLGRLYTNIGYTYTELGDLHHALDYHQRVLSIGQQLQEVLTIAVAHDNLAYIALIQGRYRDALHLLLEVESLDAEQIPVEHTDARRLRVKCYLHLNRYRDARDLAHQTIAAYSRQSNRHYTGFTLIDLAVAEAELGNYKAAQTALNEAEAIFTYVGAQTWAAAVRLQRGQIAVRHGEIETARREAQSAANYFLAHDEQVSYATAMLLYGQATFLDHDLETARSAAIDALKIARHNRVPWLSYSSHLLLGHVAQAQRQQQAAFRRYRAAARTIERLQRSLTITLRPGFLENKQEALHSLISLYLDSGQPAAALETLERAKSQALLNHLMNREHLRWMRNDSRSQTLIDDLERLRVDHHGFYQLAYNPSLRQGQTPNKLQQEQARRDLERSEKQMRAITEQLYLQNGGDHLLSAQSPSLEAIQHNLDDDCLLIEYYDDSRRLWAFVVDSDNVNVKPLSLTPGDLNLSIQQFQFDVSCALKLCAHKGPFSAEASHLTPITQKRLETLYTSLLAPLADTLHGKRRLIIIPYGALHYLPFHLLHNGEHYLIETHEMVALPTAGMLTVEPPCRAPGALILAHPWDGRLPHTLDEAEMVQGILNGAAYYDGAARREHLLAEPRQVLHIAAHGEYRMDEPNLSFLELGDGQLYTDDLLQHDLSYELVTLSACETGRAKVAPGDELIGLGRGFLYAGAGALITSLWRIDDQLTVQIMQHLYQALQMGASKASALRDAQRALLINNPQLHPAFWGAFQLIGNAAPLSTCVKETEQ